MLKPPILYPGATWHPLKDHSAPGTLEQRKLIVLHVTAGATAQSAIWTFEGSKAPNRVSAHFVIDQDGTVYQLLDLRETAWHASSCNSYSIGIEHAAIPGKLPASQAQYVASSKLVRWLCETLAIPCDRRHIVGHFEASPKDGHVECCEGALSADRVVEMANQAM